MQCKSLTAQDDKTDEEMSERDEGSKLFPSHASRGQLICTTTTQTKSLIMVVLLIVTPLVQNYGLWLLHYMTLYVSCSKTVVPLTNHELWG